MFSRLLLAALVAGAAAMSGCSSTHVYDGTGRSPPQVKMHNGKRIVKEAGWFYADIQDVVFGVDYNADMEAEFGGGPY